MKEKDPLNLADSIVGFFGPAAGMAERAAATYPQFSVAPPPDVPNAIVWNDICFTVTTEWINEAVVSIKVYEIVGWNGDGVPVYGREGAVSALDGCSPMLTGAEVFLQGDIKFDGCSNLCFKDGDCMLHFCGRGDLVKVGTLLTRLHDLVKEMFGKGWQGE